MKVPTIIPGDRVRVNHEYGAGLFRDDRRPGDRGTEGVVRSIVRIPSYDVVWPGIDYYARIRFDSDGTRQMGRWPHQLDVLEG